MDPTPPPPPHFAYSSSTSAAASSFVGSQRASMSAAFLGSSTAQSLFQRRSSLYPPPLPSRLASRASAWSDGAADGSLSPTLPPLPPSPPPIAPGRRRSQTSALYEELCMTRSTSAEYIANLNEMAEAYRASSRARQQQLNLHAPSSSPSISFGVPPLQGGTTFVSQYGASSSSQPQASSPASSSGGGPSSQYEMQARPSPATSASVPQLLDRSFFQYGMTSSQPQELPSAPAISSSGVPQLPGGGSFFQYGPSLSQLPVSPSVQQSSSNSSEQYELPPLPPVLHKHLLSVKQEPDSEDSTCHCREPELIQIDDEEEEDDLGLGALMASFESTPGALESLEPSGVIHLLQDEVMTTSSWGATGSTTVQQSYPSQMPMVPTLEQVANTFGTMTINGSSSSAPRGGSMAWNHHNRQSSMAMFHQHVPYQQPMPADSSTPGFVQQLQPSSALDLPPLPPSLWSTESQRVQPPTASSPVANSSRSISTLSADGSLFTDAEIAIIMNDRRLRELVSINPRRVKRMLSNRASAARLNAHALRPGQNCRADVFPR